MWIHNICINTDFRFTIYVQKLIESDFVSQFNQYAFDVKNPLTHSIHQTKTESKIYTFYSTLEDFLIFLISSGSDMAWHS